MLKPDRLCAFGDGVVAIAITLLVLGLEVPSVHEQVRAAAARQGRFGSDN